jgi:autotransporter-associated beta strand protein
MGGDITDGGDGTNGTSTLKLDGAVLDMQGHRIGTSIPIDNLNLYSGTIKNVGGLNSVIGGAGLVKNWDGTTAKTLVLDGTNTYTGDTKVTGGTLKLASTVSLTSSVIDVGAGAYLDVTDFGPAGYTVAAGNTIKGSGTVNGSLNVLGTLSPGSSPGLLTVNGDVTLSGNYSAEIAGNAPGTGYDQLLVIGANRTVTLGGTLSVTSTYTPGASDMFWIIVNDDATSILSGAFSNYANGDPIPALPGFNIYYHADYSTNSLTGGNDVVLAIPEPATLLMLVIAAGLCLAFRRARKA